MANEGRQRCLELIRTMTEKEVDALTWYLEGTGTDSELEVLNKYQLKKEKFNAKKGITRKGHS